MEAAMTEMTDTDRLAALLCELFPTAERSRWPFSVQLAAERLVAAGVGFVGDADHYPGCDRNPCRCAGYTATPAPCPVHGVECGIVPTDFGQQIANPEARPKGLPIAATPAPLPPANPSLMGTIQKGRGDKPPLAATPAPLDVDPWTALRDEVDAMNRWYGERGNPCSAWVGWWPATGWYGGCGYDGEPMEEMADADGDTPEATARNLVRLMAEYRERVDRQREEDNRE
jgi:hypothetical protein